MSEISALGPRPPALRALLARDDALVLPFAYDAFSALLIAEAGFDACGISGSGLSASLLGLPDAGLLTQTELVQATRRVAAISPIPVLADADTGFGGVTSAVRTLQELEAAGAAGMIIEDQQSPKRCGHLAGISLIETDEMAAKIAVLARSRHDRDFVIVGRTDAIGAGDDSDPEAAFDQAVRRARAYLDAGADVAFVSALRSEEQLKALPAAVGGPLLVILTEGGRTPFVPTTQLADWGYRIIGYAGTAIAGAAGGALAALRELRQQGTTGALADRLMGMSERNRILQLERYEALDDSAR